jgi:hypothetical protein
VEHRLSNAERSGLRPRQVRQATLTRWTQCVFPSDSNGQNRLHNHISLVGGAGIRRRSSGGSAGELAFGNQREDSAFLASRVCTLSCCWDASASEAPHKEGSPDPLASLIGADLPCQSSPSDLRSGFLAFPMSVRMGFHVAVVPPHAGSDSRPGSVTLGHVSKVSQVSGVLCRNPSQREDGYQAAGRGGGSRVPQRPRALGNLLCSAEPERLSRRREERVVELGTQHRLVHQAQIQGGQCLCRGCDSASIGYPVLR